ncbi:MAG: polyphosphate kinase 1 [Bacteroidota bacterium]
MDRVKVVPLINRDISWLAFNGRVLQEADDKNNPLIERMRFLGIFSNNRDEFFRVRVATVLRMSKIGKTAEKLLGDDPEKLMGKIQKMTIKQQESFERIYINLLKEMEAQQLFMIDELHLDDHQGKFVKEYFHDNVLQTLVPIMLDSTLEFPYLKDKSIYLILKLARNKKKPRYSLVEIPTDRLSRFLVLPSTDEKKYIILLDDVIRYCLDDVFSIFDYDTIESYTIKLTRDAELDIDNDVSKSFVEKIARSVKKRKKGQPVRMIFDEAMPDDMLIYLKNKLKMHKEDSYVPGGRYHNFKDFIDFPKVGRSELRFHSMPPVDHKDLAGQRSLLKVIKQKDVLLCYPYHSFLHTIELLREASIDPKVVSIKITLYRVARNSSIVNALINAVKNGKAVTAVVEVQARFDEEANIYWADKLIEEGVKVIYGVPGLKVHSKLFLITRNERGEMVNYASIGTGNFNENTAKLYSDLSLITADKRITNEVASVFNFYTDNLKKGVYRHLVVSPFQMRRKFLALIENEIKNKKAGKDAYIYLKLNSLVDHDLIVKLYKASQAGVKIKLIIRGICSLVPGVEGLSENIEAISIVGRYLEHGRIFIFCNNNDEKYYISSADWMIRNLDFRSEVAVPVYNKELQMELKKIVETQWKDNVKARILDRKQKNVYVKNSTTISVISQDEIYKEIKHQKKHPDLPTKSQKK